MVSGTVNFRESTLFSEIQLSTTIEGRRKALLDAGARLTEETYGQREPRRGVMRL